VASAFSHCVLCACVESGSNFTSDGPTTFRNIILNTVLSRKVERASVTVRFIAEDNSALETAIDFTTENTGINGSWHSFPSASRKTRTAQMAHLPNSRKC
jgi:hypothetical protein